MNKEFTASLKSIEIENIVDLYFYRPIAYQISRVLKHTSITPNMVTVFSIFIGAGAAFMFYFDNLNYNLIGILLLVIANILDCVDGQLARLTGIYSKIGRLLDGIAGDIWFFLIYISLAWRLTCTYNTAWFFIPAILSGLSHLMQANITDYYKTLHLYFESKEKGKEFQSQKQVKAQQQKMKFGLDKFFYSLYDIYTGFQEKMTPVLQQMLTGLYDRYGDDIPQDIRLHFRQKSNRLMKQCIDFMTFNGRSIMLFLVIISGYVWIYFIYEIVILNCILFIAIRKHEKMCQQIYHKIAEI